MKGRNVEERGKSADQEVETQVMHRRHADESVNYFWARGTYPYSSIATYALHSMHALQGFLSQQSTTYSTQ